jgi:hypothetical protein
MGTYCAIHIKESNRAALVSELERYLAETHQGQVIQTTTAETFGKLYGDEFLCSEEQPPTKFAIVSEQPGWFTAHYNSFLRLGELATELSRSLNTVVISVIAQSCSSGYLLSIYQSGRSLRTLEFADGSWIKQEGPLLPFESEPLGKNIAEPGVEPYYVFENESVREYCEHFGLKLWTYAWMEREHPEFTIIRALPPRVHALEERE